MFFFPFHLQLSSNWSPNLIEDLLNKEFQNVTKLPHDHPSKKPKLPSNNLFQNVTKDELLETFYPGTIDFNLNCNLQNKVAIYAINRASTQQCKQEIADAACLSQSNTLYPSSLPSYCPFKGNLSYTLC